MIEIRKSKNADSRSAEGPLTIEKLKKDTDSHIKDVRNAMKFIRDELTERASNHDHTKLENMEDFHAALTSGKVKESKWYEKHITEERHHLKSNVPKDVNLIDVMEHVVDCTMAGLARSGEVYDIDLPVDLLRLAVENTVELLKKNTKVITESYEQEEVDILNENIED